MGKDSCDIELPADMFLGIMTGTSLSEHVQSNVQQDREVYRGSRAGISGRGALPGSEKLVGPVNDVWCCNV